MQVETELGSTGWQGRSKAIVIDPEGPWLAREAIDDENVAGDLWPVAGQ